MKSTETIIDVRPSAIEADGFAIGCQEIEQDLGYDKRPRDDRPWA